jgi:hAT family C-terminal dimerisation region
LNDNPALIDNIQQSSAIDDYDFGFGSPEINTQPNAADEVSRILSYQSNMPVLEFWATHGSEFPILKCLASKYLSIPATNASSERGFSQVNLIDTDLRNRLSVEKINQMVMAKVWLKRAFPSYFE